MWATRARKTKNRGSVCFWIPARELRSRPGMTSWKLQRRHAFAPRQDRGFLQIQIALQPAPRFVGDLAVAQKPIEEVTLGGRSIPCGRRCLREARRAPRRGRSE